MRKKILLLLGAIAVMTVVLSVTVCALDEPTLVVTTDYGLISVLLEKLTMFINALFKIADAVYQYMQGFLG